MSEKRSRRTVRRAVAWAAGTPAALILLIAVAGLPLYVFPPAEEVGIADLIYVLGPPTPERVAVERAMREDGVAPQSLYSVASQGPNSAEAIEACTQQGVTCVSAEPFTTSGEALVLNEFAVAHDVGRTIVLTSTPHVARTRYIFDKCVDGDVTVVAVDQRRSLGGWIYQYAYQTTAFVKAWATPCATADGE